MRLTAAAGSGTILKSTLGASSVTATGTALASFDLAQNFPNPVAQSTQFSFTIQTESEATLKVYSLDGKEVKTLVESGSLNAGTHTITWDGTANDGTRLADGAYLYKLTAGELTIAKRLTIVH